MRYLSPSARAERQVVNPCCAILGESAPMQVRVLPESFPDSQIKWRVVSGAGSFPNGDTGRNVVFSPGGAEGATNVLQVDVGDVQGAAPQFRVVNTTMHEVKIYPCVISRMGRPSPITQSHLDTMLAEVNTIFRQVGMHFSYGASITNVTNDVWAENGLVRSSIGNQIRNIMSGKDGLEIYFIPGEKRKPGPGKKFKLGVYNPWGIIVRTSANAKTMAHEIGHACGLHDIFVDKDGLEPSELSDFLVKDRLKDDWSNGTGTRFYELLLRHETVIRRLLMFGERSDEKSDIPTGSVFGLSEDGVAGAISVGRSTWMSWSPFSQ